MRVVTRAGMSAGRLHTLGIPTHAHGRHGAHADVGVGAVVRGAEGALRADGAEEGRDAVREPLAPAEAHRGHGVLDGGLRYGHLVRHGLLHPLFWLWDVAQEPGMLLKKDPSNGLLSCGNEHSERGRAVP